MRPSKPVSKSKTSPSSTPRVAHTSASPAALNKYSQPPPRGTLDARASGDVVCEAVEVELWAAAPARAYHADPRERIALIRQGVPASKISELSTVMGWSKEGMLASLGLSRATIGRKERDATLLSKDESERVLGVASLIGMVQAMVEQSGDPRGFDAARWVANWLTSPLPALGGDTPASYMDTFEGQKLVAELLAMSQSGAYA